MPGIQKDLVNIHRHQLFEHKKLQKYLCFMWGNLCIRLRHHGFISDRFIVYWNWSHTHTQTETVRSHLLVVFLHSISEMAQKRANCKIILCALHFICLVYLLLCKMSNNSNNIIRDKREKKKTIQNELFFFCFFVFFRQLASDTQKY